MVAGGPTWGETGSDPLLFFFYQALARVVPAIKEEILAVIDIFNSVKIW
jgi:hypothetical protein